MKSSSRISWSTPLAFSIAKGKREIQTVYSPGALFRIALATIAVFVIAFFTLEQYIPTLEFDWIAAFFKCAVMLVAILALSCLVALIPAMLTISPRGIMVSQGQTAQLHRFEDLAEIRIVEGKGEYPLLVFRRRDQTVLREYAISPKVPLDDLREFLAKHAQHFKNP